MQESPLLERVVWSGFLPKFMSWLTVAEAILAVLSILFIGVSSLNLLVKLGICAAALVVPIPLYVIGRIVRILWQRSKQYDLLYGEFERTVKQTVPQNEDIYLGVCLFRDIKTKEQEEQDQKTLQFYIALKDRLEGIWQQGEKTDRKVVTRRNFREITKLHPGQMPVYANVAFSKILICKYFVLVIQKVPDEISGGSHLIEVGYALAKGKPVLCYIEEGMYKPMFLRELNTPSHYRLIPFSGVDDLFRRLESIDVDFRPIEPK